MTGFDYTINENGTIDIASDGISLSGIYPFINEKPVLPLSIDKGTDYVNIHAPEGSINVSVKLDDSELVLTMIAAGFDHAHDIEPVGAARLSGADHVYVQGLGMEGPSGYYTIDAADRRSHGMIGLSGNDTAIAAFVTDHRKYSSQFSVKEQQNLYSKEAVFTAGINLEKTMSGTVELPELHFLAGTDIQDCMSRAAGRIAEKMCARTFMPPAYHWCSWYYNYENMNMEFLAEYLKAFREENTDFRYIQLDAGYTDHIGDWDSINSRYPNGLGEAAEAIRAAGFEAGIWIAPFMVGDQSRLYREHPDWIVRLKDGSPYIRFRSYTEPKIWGNTDNDYYVLDMTNPDAYAYLKGVFERLRKNGFTLYKTDFLLWGMVDTSTVSIYDESKTSFMIMRDTLAMIRDAIGEDSYLLGSIAPFMPCIGYTDGMRIASDMGAQWTEGAFGPANLLQELPYDNYFNNVFWQNDPDSVILRDFATHLTDTETWSIALLQALSGGIITTSDPVHLIAKDRKELLRFIRPDGKVHAEMPFLVKDGAINCGDELVITHHLKDWNLFYVLNPTDHTLKIHYDLTKIFGTGTFQYRFDRNDGDTIVSESCSYLSDAIGPHDCVLMFITDEPLTVKPSNLWGRTIR